LRKATRLTLFLAAMLVAGTATAQVLYKWIDDQGKTQYSDRPPKNFKGELIRIDTTEGDKTTLPPAAPPAPAKPASAAPANIKITPIDDVAAKRRATRTRLEEQLTKAREKVASAKAALEQAQVPEPDDRQIVQQRTAGGGMHGMAPRSNCRVEGSGATKTLMCPTFVPTPEYHEKITRLEEDVRKAEDDLSAAELAWRRGVD
jgi:hypothetical protein